MRIIALSLLLLSALALAGCQSKAEKVKKLQDQYNAEYPAYAKDLPGRRHLRCRKNADRREADRGADGGSRSQEERAGGTVQARGRPSCERSSEKFLPHSSNAGIAARASSHQPPTANERITQ